MRPARVHLASNFPHVFKRREQIFLLAAFDIQHTP